MGTAVMGFAAGVLAGVMLAACGGGDDDGERVSSADRAQVLVCRPGDQACQEAAAFGAARRCVLQPGGLLLYLGAVDDEVLREVLRERGYWQGNGKERIEGEDCV